MRRNDTGPAHGVPGKGLESTLGRPRTDRKIEAKIRQLAAKGMGKGKIARTLGIGVSVTQRVLAG